MEAPEVPFSGKTNPYCERSIKKKRKIATELKNVCLQLDVGNERMPLIVIYKIHGIGPYIHVSLFLLADNQQFVVHNVQ